MTWQIAVISAYRVLGSLPVLRWPLAGGVLALIVDFGDLFLMDLLGGVDDYQRWDKTWDLAYMATFAIVALRWSGLERGVALALFAFRMLGGAVFEITGAREVLFAFPNVFEFWFLFVAARHRLAPGAPLRPRAAAVAGVVLLALKEVQEYGLHVARALDPYVATDVAASWWRALTGGR